MKTFVSNSNMTKIVEKLKLYSTNEAQSRFTDEEKAKLESLENYQLPIASDNVAGGIKLGSGLNIDENGVASVGKAGSVDWANVEGKPEMNSYATDAELAEAIKDFTTKSYVDNLVEAVYHFKGSVVDENALNNIIDASVGDVYNIESTGMNAAWTGTEWDNLGSVVDLSEYIKIADLNEMTDEEINALFV